MSKSRYNVVFEHNKLYFNLSWIFYQRDKHITPRNRIIDEESNERYLRISCKKYNFHVNLNKILNL